MKRFLKTGLLLAVIALAFSSCSCYNKMKKKVAAVQTTSTPAVLSLQGKEVSSTYTVEFPAEYFKPKAILRVTPVIVYEGGELAGTPVYVQGTKVKDNYTVINKQTGGKITQTVSFPYNPQMRQSVLELRVDSKCDKKNSQYVPFAVIHVADGVSTVQELADLSGRPAIAADNFQRNTTISQEARIMFLINKADVRPAQLNSTEIKALEDFIVENSGDAKKSVGNIYTKAYASPDGPTDFNNKLSQDRARNTETALNRKYAEDKLPGDLDFDVEALGEDWEGFKELVEASDIPDKNLILQVLQMYSNPEQREREIKNMSAAFNVLKDKVLPELRRSKLRVDVNVEGLSDQEIRAAVAQNIANLNVEEMLFAATLYDGDLDQQAKIYKAAADKYNDYRAWNNYGAILLKQGNVTEAGAAIQRASQLNSSSNEVINNLGLAALAAGNNDDARRYLTSINTPNSVYNTGLLNLMDGNYSEAVKTLEGYNLAVAEVLNGNPSRAKSLLASETCAYADYLKAVIAAREGDSAGVTSNLRSATSKEASLKNRAKTDIEFAKWYGSSDFNDIVR